MAGLLLLHVGLFLACAALSAAKARRLGLRGPGAPPAGGGAAPPAGGGARHAQFA